MAHFDAPTYTGKPTHLTRLSRNKNWLSAFRVWGLPGEPIVRHMAGHDAPLKIEMIRLSVSQIVVRYNDMFLINISIWELNGPDLDSRLRFI